MRALRLRLSQRRVDLADINGSADRIKHLTHPDVCMPATECIHKRKEGRSSFDDHRMDTSSRSRSKAPLKARSFAATSRALPTGYFNLNW